MFFEVKNVAFMRLVAFRKRLVGINVKGDSMSHNLQYQFLSAINGTFKEGMDKHSIQRENGKGMSDKIYSYANRKDLVQTSAAIARYMTDNYQVRYLREISEDMMQSFIKSKVGLSNYTINKKSKAGSYIVLDLAGRFALRVSECCAIRVKDIRLDVGILHVHGAKGGRDRDLPIQNNDYERLEKYYVGLHPEKKIVCVYEDSVNAFLRRACEYLGLDQYKECKTGVHAIRKMRAQEIYDTHREEGHSKEDTISYVNTYLGHGANRTDVTRAYIKNTW